MKKVIEYQYMFRSEFKVRQEVNDGIKTSISYIKYELQNSIEMIYWVKQKRENRFGCMVMD